jgi:hypothetical protein
MPDWWWNQTPKINKRGSKRGQHRQRHHDPQPFQEFGRHGFMPV